MPYIDGNVGGGGSAHFLRAFFEIEEKVKRVEKAAPKAPPPELRPSSARAPPDFRPSSARAPPELHPSSARVSPELHPSSYRAPPQLRTSSTVLRPSSTELRRASPSSAELLWAPSIPKKIKKTSCVETNILCCKIFESHFSENEIIENWSMAVGIWLFFGQLQRPITRMSVTKKINAFKW